MCITLSNNLCFYLEKRRVELVSSGTGIFMEMRLQTGAVVCSGIGGV